MAERNDIIRDALMLTAGAAAGVLLGRIGMPIIAKTAGLARAKLSGADAFDELIADHKRVLTALEKALVEQSGPKKTTLFATIKRDLSKHAIAEEDVVYPLIADKLLAPDAAKHLYEEHGQVKTLLAEIEEALETGDDLRYRARVRVLLNAVREHADEEETRWFPQLKAALDEKKRAAISGKVDREKALLA